MHVCIQPTVNPSYPYTIHPYILILCLVQTYMYIYSSVQALMRSQANMHPINNWSILHLHPSIRTYIHVLCLVHTHIYTCIHIFTVRPHACMHTSNRSSIHPTPTPDHTYMYCFCVFMCILCESIFVLLALAHYEVSVFLFLHLTTEGPRRQFMLKGQRKKSQDSGANIDGKEII